MSSLIDLKAELAKKESELASTNINNTSGKNKTFLKLREMTSHKKKKKKKKIGDWKEADEDKKGISEEMDEMLMKSQQKLIAKTKIYDKMVSGEMEDVEDFQGETKYLVDFEQKEVPESGRKIVSEDIFEANEEYREQLHEKWRKEQEEILNGPVHYENIKFDEVRDLGTGYFAFSKNEEERQRQMDEFKKMRHETITTQMKKEKLKNKRKAALDARLKKVKQRKAEEEGRLEEFLENEKLKETTTSSSEAAQKAVEETPQNQDTTSFKDDETLTSNTDDILQEIRKSSMKKREWDIGKQNNFTPQAFVKEKKKPSYEQRIDDLRKERPEEFAPPNFY